MSISFLNKKTLLICFSQLFSGRMGTQNQPKMGQTNKRKSNKGISSFFITVLSIFDNFQHSKAPPLLSYTTLKYPDNRYSSRLFQKSLGSSLTLKAPAHLLRSRPITIILDIDGYSRRS